MSAHLIAYAEKLPDSFQDWQDSIDRLMLPIKFKETGNPQEQCGPLEIELESQGKLETFFMSIYCSPITEVEKTSPKLFEIVAPHIGSRQFQLDFIYGSDWRELCCALGATAALMNDFDALCYVDFQRFGFITIDAALKDCRQMLKDGGIQQLRPLNSSINPFRKTFNKLKIWLLLQWIKILTRLYARTQKKQ